MIDLTGFLTRLLADELARNRYSRIISNAPDIGAWLKWIEAPEPQWPNYKKSKPSSLSSPFLDSGKPAGDKQPAGNTAASQEEEAEQIDIFTSPFDINEYLKDIGEQKKKWDVWQDAVEMMYSDKHDEIPKFILKHKEVFGDPNEARKKVSILYALRASHPEAFQKVLESSDLAKMSADDLYDIFRMMGEEA